jgi:hypothetical protein
MRNDHENRNSGSVFHTHPPCTHNVGPTLTTHPAASGLPRCRPSRHRRPPRAALQIRTLAGGRREKMGAEGNTNAGRRGAHCRRQRRCDEATRPGRGREGVEAMAHASRQQLPVASFATLHGVLGGRAQGRTTGDLRTAHHRTSHPHRAALARASSQQHGRRMCPPRGRPASDPSRWGPPWRRYAPAAGRPTSSPARRGGLRIGVEQNRNKISRLLYRRSNPLQN